MKLLIFIVIYNIINKILNINNFIENMNFSFDAILDIYMNKINIPPIKIRNKIYDIKYDLIFKLHVKDEKIVCINKMNPIDNGCFINKKFIDNNIIIIISIFITENNLILKSKLWKFNLTLMSFLKF